MMLICISDGTCEDGSYYLTIGKIYYSYDYSNNKYLIKNDIGFKHYHPDFLFRTINEVRKKKLNKLNEIQS